MWGQLTPIERVYLGFVAAIVVSQIYRGEWDPAAVGAIAIFIGLIPAGRLDRQKQKERERAKQESDEFPVVDPGLAQQSRDVLRKYLEGG